VIDVVGPALKCGAHCVEHLAAIVDTSNATLSAANVVERLFDYMREDA
jgi:hypothetical protein